MKQSEDFIEQKLALRKQQDNFRVLKTASGLVDFCSNDYLGFARSEKLKALVEVEIKKYPAYLNGSGGSRLLSGNTVFAEELEQQIASFHQAEAGLIFNSGYDANLGLFSCLPQKGDTIITDELIHACIIDGARLSYANRFTFKHNNLDDLEKKLQNSKGVIYVAVESVYSMDGDQAPLQKIIQLTQKYNANLIVDEAHATGVFGSGLVQLLNLEKQVFARTITFGKALGSHGAIVLGSSNLRQYLINFARSFIYTTAPSFHQLVVTKMAYQLLKKSEVEQIQLKNLILLFKKQLQKQHDIQLIPSDSAIQSILISGNLKVKKTAANLQQNGFDVRAILSPTVPIGMERLRICIHTFNTEKEIFKLTSTMNQQKPLFVTGIGTGVGKTYVAAHLVETLQADYWKPIQSGDLEASDTMKVRSMVKNPISVFHPEAYRLTQPFSPHKSAALDGIMIDPNQIVLPQTQNKLIIEGAGGLMVPLNNSFLMIDLIRQLQADVVLVVMNYLGSINHTLLSVAMLKQYNLPIDCIIFNGIKEVYSEDVIKNKHPELTYQYLDWIES